MTCETLERSSPDASRRSNTPVVQNKSLVVDVILLSPRMAYPTDPSFMRSEDTRADIPNTETRRG